MAIIGSAEVEVRANVRKLGSDIKDSFKDLDKFADDVAEKMGKSIEDSLKKHLDGFTVDIRINDRILDEILEVREHLNRLGDEEIVLKLDDTQMQKLNTYRGRTLRYDVDLDTTYLDKQLAKISDQKIDLKVSDKAAKKVQKEVESVVDSLPAKQKTVEIETEISRDSRRHLTQGVKDLMKDVQKIAERHATPIDFDVNTAKVIEQLEQIREWEEEDLEMGVVLESSDLEKINVSLEALRKYNEANAINMRVELNAKAAMAKLAMLSKKKFVEIVPKVNAKAMAIAQGTLAGFTGFNFMKDHTKDFIKSLTELDKQLPQTIMLLSGISAVVPAAGWGAGVLSKLIGDLASLSGLLVPGSALLAAYAGSMVFFNNAFSKPNKEKYIPEITAQLKDFSEAVAGDFWKVAKPSYKNFAFNTLPKLYGATKDVNKGVAGLAASFWDSIGAVLETDRGMRNLKQISGNVSKGMDGIGKAIEPVIQGLLTFVRVGSDYLPGLGKHIEDIAEKFDSWVQMMDETGKLKEWGDVGINALTQLGRILYNTVGILQSLYSAADAVGFPGLEALADGLEKINGILATDEAGRAMRVLGAAFKESFDVIASGLSWIGPLFVSNFDGIVTAILTMGDIVGGILTGIGNALTNTNIVPSFLGLFEHLKGAVETFQPAFESIGTIMAVTFDFLGAALDNITPIITQFFENLENDAVLVKPSLMGVLDIIGTWGPEFMRIFGLVTNAVAEWFGKLDPYLALAGIAIVGLGGIAVSGIGAVAGAFLTLGDLGGKIVGFAGNVDEIGRAFGRTVPEGQLIQGVLKQAGGAFKFLGGAVKFLSGPWGWIIGAFVSAFMASEDLRRAVGDFLVGAFKTLLAFVQPLIGPIGQLFGVLMEGMDKVAAAIAPAFTGLFNVLNSLWPIIQLVARFLGAVLGAAIQFLVPILESLLNTVATVAGGLANFLGGALNFMAENIKGIINIIKALISGDMGAVKDAIISMGEGMLNALLQMFDGLIQAVGGIFVGLVDLVLAQAKGVLEGVLSFMKSFNISEAGQAIIQSLIDGFTAAIDAVRQWLQDLTQKIIEWKGPPDNDATLLNDAGSSIIMSLVNGFISAVGAVFEFLAGLTADIVSSVVNFFAGIGGYIQAGIAAIVGVAGAAWQLLVDGIQLIWDLIMQIIQLYINLIVTIVTTGWNGLVTVVQTVWNAILAAIQFVVDFILLVIQTWITVVTTIFTTGWNTLVTIVTSAWSFIQSVISTAINVVRSIITTTFTIISTVIRGIWEGIKTIISSAWSIIQSIVSAGVSLVRTVISTGFTIIRTTITTIWNAIKSFFSTVWGAIKGLFTTAISAVKLAVTAGFSSIRNAINTVMNAARTIISNVWNAIKSVFSSAISTAKSVVSSGFNAIRSVISSVMNAARSVIASVWGAVKSLFSSSISTIRSVVSSGFNALKGIVTNAMNAVKSAIQRGISSAVNLFKSLPGKIKSALGNLGSLLTGAGKSIIQGLINGVSGMIGSLKSKFSSITDMIPSWKGPPDTDAHLLTNAGELIMQGLIEGLESKYGAVKNSLQGFTGDLSQTVGTQIGADVGMTATVRSTAFSEAERAALSRATAGSMVQSSGEREVHLHFYQPMANAEEIIMVANRELGRG